MLFQTATAVVEPAAELYAVQLGSPIHSSALDLLLNSLPIYVQHKFVTLAAYCYGFHGRALCQDLIGVAGNPARQGTIFTSF
jgi:hypothetical protein